MIDFFEFASRGKNQWWRYLLSIGGAFLFAIVLLTAIMFFLMALHLYSPQFLTALRQPKDAPVFFLGTGAMFGALVLGLAVSLYLIQRKRPLDIVGHWRWRLYFQGLAIWFVVQSVLGLIDFLIAPKGFSITASENTLTLAASALIGLGIQTFAEEFFFRGMITQWLLLKFKNPVSTAIASGIVFGACHIPNGLPQAMSALLFGIACALIAIRTGGLAFTCGLHLTNNVFGAVALVSTSDVFKNSPGLFTQNTPGLVWWDTMLSLATFAGLIWLVQQGRILPNSAPIGMLARRS
jgi:membrane protease YdiL (CAAX protease family)